MTPEERRAALDQAQKLLAEVEANDAAVDTPTPVVVAPATAAVAQPAPLTFPNHAVDPTPAFTGPGGDTRQSRQPAIHDTIMKVANDFIHDTIMKVANDFNGKSKQ